MVDKDLDISRDEMLDEMAKLLAPFVVEPMWATVKDLAKRWEITDQGAKTRLEKMEKEEKVIKHKDPVSKRVYYEMVKQDD